MILILVGHFAIPVDRGHGIKIFYAYFLLVARLMEKLFGYKANALH